jgi:Ferritin-like domain
MAPFLTRREALGGAAAALVLASCGGGDPPPATGPKAGSGAALLGSLLALEHASVAAYGVCLQVLDGRARAEIDAIRAQDRAHAAALERLIAGLGGDPPPGRTAEEYARTFPRLQTSEDALRFAQDLEERQVRAYLEALTDLPDPDLRNAAAAACGDEATHLATARVLQGLPAAEGPFVTGAL